MVKTRLLLSSIIIFCYSFLGAQRTDDKALMLADSLYSLIMADTSRFHEITELFTDDPGFKINEGVYGYAKGEYFVEPIASLVRGHERFEIIPPFQSVYGYHILQPLGKRGDEIKFKHLLIAIKPE